MMPFFPMWFCSRSMDTSESHNKFGFGWSFGGHRASYIPFTLQDSSWTKLTSMGCMGKISETSCSFFDPQTSAKTQCYQVLTRASTSLFTSSSRWSTSFLGASLSILSCHEIPWLFASSPWEPIAIEIDGLPIKNGWSFHGYVSHNQMVMSQQKCCGPVLMKHHPSSNFLPIFQCRTYSMPK